MRLKDLVTLPRMRSRKKKDPSVSAYEISPAPSKEVSRFHHDLAAPTHKDVTRFDRDLAAPAQYGPRDDSMERIPLAEACWRGNVLYRGVEGDTRSTRAGGGAMMLQKHTTRGMVVSHSTEGFPSGMMLMAQSYDARMAVSEYGGSSSRLSTACGVVGDSLQQPQQYYQCSVHRHDHRHHHHYHHHHHHHLLEAPTTRNPVSQNQQQLSTSSNPQNQKSEPGFFRKSFASFRSLRKKTHKSNDAANECKEQENVRCSVCPYPGVNSAPDMHPKEKRSSKAKKKVFRSFSKQKEKEKLRVFSERDKCDRMWLSDTEDVNYLRQSTSCDNSGPYHVAMERQARECSVESCSSRYYSSRESSCVRDPDPLNIDTASLSGLESDSQRNKGNRSRSRIKTNPWLPSPVPSISGGRKSESCNLRESREDFGALSDRGSCTVPRSASFEHTRRPSLQTFTGKDCHVKSMQRQRSLTPTLLEVSSSDASSSQQITPESPVTHHKVLQESLNDLSSEPSRSRPTSFISPNSEFLMITDNIEQLATNISFEYEDMLDSTLETVSACPEDTRVSLHELLAEEHSNGAKTKILSSDRVPSEHSFLCNAGDPAGSAHSPDSGIGGIGPSDSDELASPDSSLSETMNSMEFSSTERTDEGKIFPFLKPCNNGMVSWKLVVNESLINTEGNSFHRSSVPGKGDVSFGLYESDIDNTSYQDTAPPRQRSKDSKKTYCMPAGQAKEEFSQRSTLMVKERLDQPFQKVKRKNVDVAPASMGGHASCQDKRPSWISSKPEDMNKTQMSAKRPSLLKNYRFSNKTGEEINNIEGVSHQTTHRKSGSGESSDFPRNITQSDLVESPTDNWYCERKHDVTSGDLPTGSGSAMTYDPLYSCVSLVQGETVYHDRKLSSKTDNTNSGPCDNFIRCNDKEENMCLVNCCTRDGDPDFYPQSSGKDTFDISPQSPSTDMTDACCQTDFDDDDEFVPWNNQGFLDELDQSMLDPSENTRLWLLTGNMHDSADTGYSSQARDSRVFSDEDGLVFPYERNDGVSLNNASSSPAGTNNVNSQARYSGIRSDVHTDRGHPDSSCSDLLSSKDVTRCQRLASDKVNLLKGTEIPKISTHPECDIQLPQTPKPTETLSEMFSSIESQFEELFQQMYCQKKTSSMSHQSHQSHQRQDSSDSSDSTLKSEGSQISASDHVELDFKANHGLNSREMCSKKISKPAIPPKPHGMLADHVYINVPHRKQKSQLERETLASQPQLKDNSSDDTPWNSKQSSTGSQRQPLDPDLTRLDLEDEQLLEIADRELLSQDNGADYLAFLRDEPLSEPDQKRSVFLIPGVGPVDMSDSDGRRPTSFNGHERAESPETETLVTLDADPETRSLAERVMVLRHQKDLVFQRIQQAHGPEAPRQQQELHTQRHIHSQRKEALLETLQDLKKRLEEQSKELQSQSVAKS